jgi:hypothetical protein
VTVPPGSAWLFGVHAQLALARTWLEAGDPSRAAALAVPLLEAAEEAGWLDAAADAALVVALCAEADGRLEDAAVHFRRAQAIPGASASAWDARLGLARLGGADADRHAAEARELIERVVADLGDDPAAAPLAATLLAAAGG